jgi:hypothetical protein
MITGYNHFGIRPIIALEDRPERVAELRHLVTELALGGRVLLLRSVGDFKDYLAGTGQFADRINYPFPRAVLIPGVFAGEPTSDLCRWIRAVKGGWDLPVFLLTSTPRTRSANAARALDVQVLDWQTQSTWTRTIRDAAWGELHLQAPTRAYEETL